MLINNFHNVLQQKVFRIIIQVVREMGIESYVVGGFVRDHLLGINNIKDIDIVAVGSGIELSKRVHQKLNNAKPLQIFKSFGTAMIQWEGVILEFVGARKESYCRESRNPKIFSGTLEDDQKRRDFTINALAISLNKKNLGELIDPFNGLQDLENCIIKTPLDPSITYTDDPLRMLRAIRFATQLNFKIEKKSLLAIEKNANRLDIITKERIVEELNKILMTQTPSIGFILLEQTGLLEKIIPELFNLKGIEEIEGQKHKDNFYHTLEVLDNICSKTDSLWLRWAALLHDIGKAPTKKFNKKIGWTFHGHEFEGSKMVYKLFKRLRMPLNEKMKYVQKLVLMSSRPIVLALDNVTDSAVRRLIFDAGDSVDDLMTLCEADITTKNKNRYQKYHDNFRIVREKIIKVEEKDNIRNFQPPISGAEIMSTFNLKPSKKIGIIKENIKDAILDGIIANNYEEAYDLMIKEGEKLGLTNGK